MRSTTTSTPRATWSRSAAGCRRYFFQSLSTDPERAREALAYIQGLFAIERTQAEASRSQRAATRQQRSRPLVEGFFAWCDAQASQVLDDTPLAKGVRYARNQRPALERFLEDGRLPIHNNVSERELRREAGVGNTFLACALGHAACRSGREVLLRADRLFQLLHQSRADHSTDRALRRLLPPDRRDEE